MKRLAIAFAVTALAVCAIDTNNVSYVAGEDSTAQITAEAQQAAAALLGGDSANGLIHAMKLSMRKYDKDMSTEEGRRSWHGRLVSEYVDTNLCFKISTYSNALDGAIWTYRQPFQPRRIMYAKRKYTAMTNGVPARLAAARARRAEILNAGGTVTTNIVIQAR